MFYYFLEVLSILEEIKKNYVYIGKGVLRGLIVTLVIAFLLALIQTYSSIGESALSICILLTSMISIIYASIYSAKRINSRGWLVGLLTSVLYILIIYIAAFVWGKEAINMRDLWRVMLAIVTGILSGMLGINL
jgi:putative membrane protein (TIGR04086 family)